MACMNLKSRWNGNPFSHKRERASHVSPFGVRPRSPLTVARWEFGFLAESTSVNFDGWRIEPVDDFEDTLREWHELSNPEGWVLPPIIEQINVQWTPEGEEISDVVPNTRRSADLWRMPSSHSLTYEGREPPAQEPTKPGAPYFIVQCLGVIIGCELQLSSWWVSGKKRLRPLGFLHPIGDALNRCLSVAYTWYDSQQDHSRKVISSSLFIHSHSESYEFTWERFLWQHMAFEGCYHLAKEVHGMKVPRYTNRFQVFADHFGLHSDPDQFGMFSDIRNKLVHEVMWANHVPGFGRDGQPWNQTIYLSNFTTLALLAVMNVETRSLQVNWRTRSCMALEAPRD